MTDDEIRQSRIDHAHMRDQIEWHVRWGTPSRVGKRAGYRKAYGYVFEAYDYGRCNWFFP